MRINPDKPVRKIGRSHSSLRGKVSSSKNEGMQDFESGLERDYFIILEFEPLVLRYVTQPIEIEYFHEGKIRYYTPDVLVYYKDDHPVSKKYQPQLTELKYSTDIEENHLEYEPKFHAAENFAKNHGWTFKVLTEIDIRTPYLDNAKFLIGYKEVKNFSSGDFLLLLNILKECDIITPAELVQLAAKDWEKKAQLIYCLWHMVATGVVFCDLTEPLTMSTEIWTV